MKDCVETDVNPLYKHKFIELEIIDEIYYTFVVFPFPITFN